MIKMISLEFILLILPFAFLPGQSFFDIARLDFINIPASYQEQGDPFEVTTLSGALNLGFKINGEDRLLLSWNGEKRMLEQPVLESPYRKNLFLNVASLGYIRSFPDSPWRLLVMSRFKLGSDYDILTSGDLSWGALAAVTYTNQQKVSFTIGGHYGEELFGPLIFPIFGIDWQISDKTYLYAFFPAEVRLEQAIKSQKLYASLVLNWMTNSYGLHDVPLKSFVRTEELILRAYLDLYLNKQIVLFAALGHTLTNDYQLRADNQSIIPEPPFQYEIRNGWILDFGLAFRLCFKN